MFFVCPHSSNASKQRALKRRECTSFTEDLPGAKCSNFLQDVQSNKNDLVCKLLRHNFGTKQPLAQQVSEYRNVWITKFSASDNQIVWI
jgi:hypothetical protein